MTDFVRQYSDNNSPLPTASTGGLGNVSHLLQAVQQGENSSQETKTLYSTLHPEFITGGAAALPWKQRTWQVKLWFQTPVATPRAWLKEADYSSQVSVQLCQSINTNIHIIYK